MIEIIGAIKINFSNFHDLSSLDSRLGEPLNSPKASQPTLHGLPAAHNNLVSEDDDFYHGHDLFGLVPIAAFHCFIRCQASILVDVR